MHDDRSLPTEVVIGAVLDGIPLTLTLAIRCDGEIKKPEHHRVQDAGDAAATLLNRTIQPDLKHTLPSVFVYSNTEAAGLCTSLDELDTESRVYVGVVNAHGKPHTSAGAGGEFSDRWSELVHRFHEKRADGSLLVDGEYHAQIAAFGAEEDRNGKTSYRLPLVVEKERERFPADGVACVVSSIQMSRGGGTGKSEIDFDPYDPKYDNE